MLVRGTLRVAWWGFAVAIVTLAVALSAARLLLPGMAEYKTQIEVAAQDFFNRPVQIGSLDAAWQGLSPVLKLEQVVIQDPQFPDGELTIDEIQVALDVVNSFMTRQWLTAGIKLIGIRLSLATDLANREKTSQGLGPLAWLLRQESFTVEDLQLSWSDPGLFKTPVELTELSLQLVNEDRRHQFLLQTALPASLGKSVKVAADLSGGADIEGWGGTVYLKTEQLQLDAVEQLLSKLPVSVRGETDLELWAGVRDGRLEWGSGSVALQDALFATSTSDTKNLTADSLSGFFQWRATETGWKVDLTEFELRRDRRMVWPASDMRLNITTGDALNIQGGATLLVLSELHSLLPLLPWIDADALTMVDRLQPQGQLRDAEFEMKFAGQAPPTFSARAKIEELHIAASSRLPGVSGLSGIIEGNLQEGYLRLDSRKATFAMPKVFPAELPVSQLGGVVHWKRYADLFRIETERLRVESDRIGFSTRWQLDWPYERSSPWLDMQIALEELPLTEVGGYLPTGVMSPKAVRWLERAFVSGVASNARVLIQGSLDQLPFDEGEGRLEARFDFQDVTLDHHPEWGQLDDLSGTAFFAGRSMHITGTSARILESRVERVVAVIKDLKRPLLQINGTVGGTLAGMLEYVNTSPLGRRYGTLIKRMETVGDARLQLDLDIPLKRGLGELQVNGSVALEGNDLLPKDSELSLRKIHGEVEFTRRGVSCDGASAELLDQPVKVSVYQEGEVGSSNTVVDIVGKLKLVELLRERQPALAPYLEGTTQWQALLQIPNQRAPGDPGFELQLLTDLTGVTSTFPVPLNKEAAAAKDLSISWVPGQESSQPIRVKYADVVDARVLMETGLRGMRKADIRFGAGYARIMEEDAIHLSGYLEELDLGHWISVLRSTTGGGGGRLPVTVDLEVKNFFLAGARLENIKAHSEVKDPWYYSLSGDAASGWVRWVPPGITKPALVMANLERLALEGREKQLASDKAGVIHPGALPELDVRIGSLGWGQRKLGRIELVTRRSPEGISVETLDMTSKAVAFKGKGAWLERDTLQSTSFAATIQGGELGELIKLFGNPGAVKGGELAGSIQLNWSGSPADFSLGTLDGDIFVKANQGRLVSVSEGGAGKLLNLVSLDSLQRRLSLDFSDVFKEGFSFNKMEGHFVVMDGDAFTNNFNIDGTSASVDIVGRTGLVVQDYDHLVTVVPRVSSGLPIAGVIAGGPAVGAAVFIAEKLVGDTFNRITQVQYEVTGTWDEPVYKKLPRKEETTDSGSTEDVP